MVTPIHQRVISFYSQSGHSLYEIKYLPHKINIITVKFWHARNTSNKENYFGSNSNT